MIRILVTVVVVLVVVVPALLFLFQRSLVYMPRTYEKHYRLLAPKSMAELRFTTSDGEQAAFYVPPRSGADIPTTAPAAAAPPRLWVVFSGNASVALDWLDLVEAYPDADTAFLLVDYPGYGLCAGKPTRAGIIRNAEGAFTALAEHLATGPDALRDGMGVMGHSIGAAAALDFAVAHPPRRLVLVSPFTTLEAMARRAVGWPLCKLLLDRFDNPARMAELAALPAPPRVDVIHGSADDIVPFAMGRELAGAFPAIARFHEVADADHNLILMTAEPLMIRLMTAPPEASGE